MRHRLWMISVLLLALATAVWAKDDKLNNVSGIAPAASGTVHTDKDKNGNVQVKVNVDHLAKPEQLSPPAQYYVVWLQERDQQPQDIGELKVGKDLKGSIQGTTPAKIFDVFITAENSRNPTTPSGQVILRGHVDRT